MRSILLIVLVLFMSVPAQSEAPKYPASKRGDLVETIQNVKIADPYRWLEDSTAQDVKDWTAEQNKFTREFLDRQPQQKQIRERLESLYDTGTLSVAVPRKGKFFFTRREGKQSQAALYMRAGKEGKETLLVDPATLSKDGTTAIDWWFPSDDGRLVAYGISESGDEHSTLFVRDVESNSDLKDKIVRTRACSLAWLPDGKGFYYTRYPKPGSVPKGEENYGRRVFLHMIGNDPDTDEAIFGQDRNATDWPNIHLSPDGRWLVIEVEQGWAKNEIYFADTSKKKLEFKTLADGKEALFDVLPRNDVFYVRTNDGAPRFKLYKVDPAKPARKDWKLLVDQNENVLERFGHVKGHLALCYMEKAASKLRIHSEKGELEREVDLPMLGTVTGMSGESHQEELMYAFQSFTMPTSVYSLNLSATKGEESQPQLFAQVTSDIDFSQFEVKQVTYQSKDKTEITMFLAGKKGLKYNGKTPTVLYGYGGFNIALTPQFRPQQFVFLEKGGLYAIANLRGGSEYGEDWHKAGMLGKKQNVFNDFIAAAEFLIKEKYTDSQHLCIEGRSNGGLLTGAAMTQRPDLFKAVVCGVPLLDMIRYHRFLIAKLWIPEYGSSEEADEFKWLYAYSPYHRVREGTKYPATLIFSAESDTRVDPLHARKMVAALQTATSGTAPIMLRMETKAGHGVGKPRSKQIDEMTDTWTFVFSQLEIK